MAASYPSSTKSFTTHTSGQTIASADVNAIQDEVVALENGLRTGLAHDVLPDTDNTRDLGSAAKQFNDAFLGGRLVSPSLDVDTTGFVNSATQPRCRVYSTATQSLLDSTFTAFTFNAETYDVGAMHDTDSNTSRITVPTGGDGLYMITGNASFNTNATGYRIVELRKNGTTIIAQSAVPSVSANNALQQNVTAIVVLAATDYVELLGAQSSGGALTCGTGGDDAHWLSAVKLW